MFRWTCFATTTLVAAALLWMVNDVRLEMKRAAGNAGEHLPQILEKTRRSSETLAELSADIRQVRDLLGATQPRDQTLVGFADRALDLVEASDGRIGIEKKLLGSGLKELQPASEWTVAARREAVFITLTAKSREQLLERLCANKFGSEWRIQIGEAEPTKLIDWLRPQLSDTMPAP